MDNIDVLINNRTELNTEEWKNYKKEEKDKLYELIDKTLLEIKDNPDKFK